MVNILVGVDCSGYGIFAFQRALRLAKEGDTMYLLTVSDGKSKSAMMAVENQKTFRKICLERKIKCVNLQEKGSPREVITKTVDDIQADILVLGSRSQGGLRKVVIGSTTDYCLRFANCSVLVAKKPPREAIPYF